MARIIGLALVLALTACAARQSAEDPLPSWTDGPSKQRIVDFVAKVTDSSGDDFVPVSERIATFDNDGTLWSEQPLYFQFLFVFDRIKSLAPDHPEWTTTQPFQAVLENDWETVKAAGVPGLGKLSMAASTGMTTEAFEAIVTEWIASARHPSSGKPYTQMVFQPMLELMNYLRSNDFKVFIVSGGGLGFMRPWTEAVYGIPPDQVVGSSIETHYEFIDGNPVIVRMTELHFFNDGTAKPIGINRFIGRRPILAAGNSDGDYQMLEWTTSGDGARLGLYVHHTDAKREWAYDRESSIGHLEKGLDSMDEKGWLRVDMARDWKVIYPRQDGE